MLNLIEITTIDDLKLLKGKTGLDDIDIEFARFLQKLSGVTSLNLALSAALASYALRNNHICLNLADYAGREFPFECESGEQEQQNYTILPELNEWIAHLKNFPKVISFSGEVKPLIVDEKNRLYIQRYFKYEQDLAQFLSEKIKQNQSAIVPENLPNISEISKYFAIDNDVDYQQVALFAALRNQLTVITGAPGSGKTTVVATILAIYYQINWQIKIGICAPTGKAAARLKESLNNELENLYTTETVKNRIANTEASTIHRLLKTKYNTPHFIHGKERKLDIDLLILDEASMVSQPLMCKLFYALKPSTKIILLGDKDQLASVEEGTVFGDISDSLPINSFSLDFCDSLSKVSTIKMKANSREKVVNTIVELTRSHRFDDSKGIGLVKNAINAGDIPKVLQIGKGDDRELQIKSLPRKNYFKMQLLRFLKNLKIEINGIKVGFEEYFSIEDIAQKFQFMNNFRILCAKRNGIYGINNINQIILEHYFKGNDKYADGIPVLITINDSRLKLFNGDIGIVKNRRIYFPDLKEKGRMRHYSPNQIPEHEVLFAMTVHKAQGSGFQKVLLVLPQKDSALLTRELLYTGITRAEKYCEIWSYDSILQSAIQRITRRNSGLKDKLMAINQAE